MKWFDDLKVSTRLGLGFGVLSLLLIIVMLISFSSIRKLNGITDDLTHDRYRKVVILNHIRDNINLASRVMRNIAMSKDHNRRIKEERQLNGAAEQILKDFAELDQTVKQEAGKKLLHDLKTARNNYIEARKKIFIMLERDQWDAASSLILNDFDPYQNAYMDAADTFLKRMDDAFIQGTANADKTGKTSERLIIALGILAVITGATSAWLVTRSILAQLGDEPKVISEIASRVADGDLTVSFDTGRTNEVGVFAAMKHMVESLQEIVSKTIDISDSIASASNQLESTAHQIATGAEEVAAQTSTVATASEEMAATSSDIARNCTMAADASLQSTEAANIGVAVVQETIQGMGVIAEKVRQTSTTIEMLGSRSEEIGDIVGTIEDIADQTNLLALNAAIEAARAGEQGRGFAVVADEVRALAERTTKATKEIGVMIKAIQNETQIAVKAMDEGVKEVEKGAVTSQKSGEALDGILNRIQEVSMQVSQIATAAEEQTATTNEVTSNVQQITTVVHITAKGADDTASAAGQLAVQAHNLQNLVSRFRLA